MKFLFALLGVALAANSYLPQARPLPTQREFRFRYEAVLSSGLPVSGSDSALTRLRADVTVQIPDERSALLQLKGIQIAAEKSDVSDFQPMERLEKRLLIQEHERLLELPVRFSYKQGLVSELQFATEEQPWSANIKRAVVNMLQMNLKAPEETGKSENGFFLATEKTIEGECEVAYSFVPEKDNFLVTKTVNFDKCVRRGDLAYNQRFDSKCPTCDDYKTIVPQTVYNYKIEKEQLKEVEVRSVYTVSLKEQPLMKTEIRSRLSLVESSEIRREIESPKGEKQELIYSNEWERTVEEFYKKGDEVEQKPFEKITRKVEIVAEIVKKIPEKKQNEPETVHMMARLVDVLRMCTEEELNQIHEKVYKSNEKKIQSIIEHSLALAGTKNTVQHLLRHAELISVPKMVQLIKSVQETPFPSEQIAELLHQFSKTESCRREHSLLQSVWLSYGAVVRGVVVPTMEKTLSETPKHLKSKFVSVMKKQWEQAESIYEKILALKTFANAGIDTSIVELEKIIYDKKQPTIVRMEAIDALRLLNEQMPRKVVKVLMPIYMNRLEKNELRMVSLAQLLQAKPTVSEISQIVFRMEREPNQHIAAFTFHLLNLVSKSTLPAYKEISSIVYPVLRTTTFRPQQYILSRFEQLSLFEEDTFSGLNVNFGAVFGKDSVIPKDIMASLETVFGGNWNRYLAQVGFSHQNVEQLFNKVISKLNLLQKEKKTTIRASRVSSSVSMLKELARKLNIRVRETVSEEAHAMFYLRYKQMDYALFPINEQFIDEIIEKYIRDGSVDLKKIEHLFNKDTDFDFTTAGYFFESIIKMPTTIGMPLTISSKLPTILSAEGSISFEKVSYGIRARVQAQPTFASTHVHTMRLAVPVFEHGVKTIRSAQIATPVAVEVEISYKKDVEIVLRQQMPEQKKTLIRVDARPVAFVRFYKKDMNSYVEAEEKTISLPKFEKIAEELSLKTEWAGLDFVLSGNNYRQWTFENIFFGEHQLELVVRPTSRVPKDISIRMIIDSTPEGRRMEGPKIEKFLQKEMKIEEGEWERNTESSRREYFHKIVREMDLSSAYKNRIVLSFHAIEKTEVELRSECEGKLSFCRISTEIRRPTERRDWKLTNIIEIVLPRPVSSLQELKEQNHREIQLYSQTMWGSEERNQIEIIAQLEQSQEQRNLAQEPKSLRGLPAYELLKRVARLNQLRAVTKYELSPKTEQIFERLFSIVRAYTLWNSQLELSQNEPRRVFLQLTVDPIYSRVSRVSLQTPEKSLRIENVHLPIVLPTIARLPKNVIRHSPVEKSECSIENGKVNTFDDVIFRAPLTTCYTVVAKDCSEEPRYAVLMKNVQKKSEQKLAKIIYEDKEYELEVVDGQLKATLNGENIRSSEYEQYKIEKIGDELYVIDFDEVVVRFDGYTVKVLLGNTEMNTQCGLCGHFDGEKKNDYRTAADEETEDIEEFHRSYTLMTEECSREVPQKKHYKEYPEEHETEQEEEYFYSEKKEKNQYKKFDYEQESEVPEDKTMVLEQPHRVCFSLQPVPQCPKGMTADRTTQKKVHFGCKPRHNSETRRMMNLVRRGEYVDVEGLEKTYSELVSVPKTCIVA